MRILQRYIGIHIISSTLLVVMVLLALFFIMSFVEELGHVGRGSYGVTEAVFYVLLTMPGSAYQILPVGTLLGTIIGLGILAGNNELVAIRSAGVSINRIIAAVMNVGMWLVLLMFVLGEWIVPLSEQYAQAFRSTTISNQLKMQGNEGLWAKDEGQIVNARSLLPGERLGDIYIYDVDKAQNIKQIRHAESAAYRKGSWVLENVSYTQFKEDSANSSFIKEQPWDTQLSPDLLNVVTVKPTTLSAMGLSQYIEYLQDNSLNAEQYQLAFWTKIVSPLVTGVMVLLAIPFVFGPLRSVTIGHRILVGVLVGVGFHLINQMFNYVGLVFHFNAAVSALIPVLGALTLAVYLLRRIH